MAKITLKGNPFETIGNLPKPGDKAPNFTLTAGDLSQKTLEDYAGKKVILNIFPSVDTPTCATSVRSFNEQAAAMENTKVVCISKDLPFAQGRFCGAEGIKNVEMLSDFVSGDFGKDYELTITNGPLNALHSRCIVVIDEKGIVKHAEQVTEIADEPNYEAALKAL